MIQHHPSELSKALGHKPHPARKSRGTRGFPLRGLARDFARAVANAPAPARNARGQALNATNRAKTSAFSYFSFLFCLCAITDISISCYSFSIHCPICSVILQSKVLSVMKDLAKAL